MIDWGAVEQSFLNGSAWGIGFAIPFFVGITYAVLKILSHPTIAKIARAADRLSSKGGDWFTTLIREGVSFLRGGGGKPP